MIKFFSSHVRIWNYSLILELALIKWPTIALFRGYRFTVPSQFVVYDGICSERVVDRNYLEIYLFWRYVTCREQGLMATTKLQLLKKIFFSNFLSPFFVVASHVWSRFYHYARNGKVKKKKIAVPGYFLFAKTTLYSNYIFAKNKRLKMILCEKGIIVHVFIEIILQKFFFFLFLLTIKKPPYIYGWIQCLLSAHLTKMRMCSFFYNNKGRVKHFIGVPIVYIYVKSSFWKRLKLFPHPTL